MYFITLPSPQYYIHFLTICTNYFQTEMVVMKCLFVYMS